MMFIVMSREKHLAFTTNRQRFSRVVTDEKIVEQREMDFMSQNFIMFLKTTKCRRIYTIKLGHTCYRNCHEKKTTFLVWEKCFTVSLSLMCIYAYSFMDFTRFSQYWTFNTFSEKGRNSSILTLL